MKSNQALVSVIRIVAQVMSIMYIDIYIYITKYYVSHQHNRNPTPAILVVSAFPVWHWQVVFVMQMHREQRRRASAQFQVSKLTGSIHLSSFKL